METLAKYPHGLTHQELQKRSKLSNNGSYHRALDELIISDFVLEMIPFGKKKRGTVFRLVDEYSHFYHQFIKEQTRYTPGIWQQLAASQRYKIWAGYAFEIFCLRHLDLIKKALGIGAVFTEVYTANIAESEAGGGFQIDLILDRKDDTIHLFEMKFYAKPFQLNRTEYEKLTLRRQRFVEYVESKKQVLWTFITSHGILRNEYTQELIDSVLTIDDLIN